MLASQSTILRLDKATKNSHSSTGKADTVRVCAVESTGENAAKHNTSGTVKQQNEKLSRKSQSQSGIGSCDIDQQDWAQMQKLSGKPQRQIGRPSQDKQYIDELLDIVDGAIVAEYGNDNNEALALSEILEALKAVETKSHCRKLTMEGGGFPTSGDKINHVHHSNMVEHKRAKLEVSDPTRSFPGPENRVFSKESQTLLSNGSLENTPHSTPSSTTPTAGAEMGVAPGVELLLSRSEEKMLLGDLERDVWMTNHSSPCYN